MDRREGPPREKRDRSPGPVLYPPRGEDRERPFDDRDRGRDRRFDRRGPRPRMDDGRPPPRDDWYERRGGGRFHGGRGGRYDRAPPPSWMSHAPPPRGSFRGSPPTDPLDGPLKSYKEFMICVNDDDITPERAAEMYAQYKRDYEKKLLQTFFDAHKSEEWFQEIYDPAMIAILNTDKKERCKAAQVQLLELLERDQLIAQCGDRSVANIEREVYARPDDDAKEKPAVAPFWQMRHVRHPAERDVLHCCPPLSRTRAKIFELLNAQPGLRRLVIGDVEKEPQDRGLTRHVWAVFQTSADAQTVQAAAARAPPDVALRLSPSHGPAIAPVRVTPEAASDAARIARDIAQATSLITLLDAQRGLTPCLPALLSPVHHLRPCPTPATASLDEMLAQLTLLLPPPAAPAAPTPVPPAGAGAPAAGASTVTASSPPPPAPAACTAGAAATAGTTAATATATAEGAEAGGPGAMALEQADAAQQSGTEDGALPPAERLDRLVTYLRFVHCFCYYCGLEYATHEDLLSRCGLMHYRGRTPDSGAPAPATASTPAAPAGETPEKGKAANKDGATALLPTPPTTQPAVAQAWQSILDTRIATRLQYDPTTDERLGESARVAALEAFLRAHVIELEPSKYRCDHCNKLFRGPDFVRKHYHLKHPDILQGAARTALDAQFFANYSADPFHLAIAPPRAPPPRPAPPPRAPPRAEPSRRRSPAPPERPLVDYHDLDNVADDADVHAIDVAALYRASATSPPPAPVSSPAASTAPAPAAPTPTAAPAPSPAAASPSSTAPAAPAATASPPPHDSAASAPTSPAPGSPPTSPPAPAAAAAASPAPAAAS